MQQAIKNIIFIHFGPEATFPSAVFRTLRDKVVFPSLCSAISIGFHEPADKVATWLRFQKVTRSTKIYLAFHNCKNTLDIQDDFRTTRNLDYLVNTFRLVGSMNSSLVEDCYSNFLKSNNTLAISLLACEAGAPQSGGTPSLAQVFHTKLFETLDLYTTVSASPFDVTVNSKWSPNSKMVMIGNNEYRPSRYHNSKIKFSFDPSFDGKVINVVKGFPQKIKVFYEDEADCLN